MKRLLFLLLLCSCQTPPKIVATENVVTRYDLKGTVNGVPFEGIGVIPFAPTYAIEVKSPQSVNVFTITSCHREIAAASPDKNSGVTYQMFPSPGIENIGSCLIRIGSYNKSVPDNNGHAILDISPPGETLPARNICNGANGDSRGVSMCQSKIGLVQRLTFLVPVRNITEGIDKVCKGKWIDLLTWEYQITDPECVIGFIEVAKPHRRHRHTVIGYTKVRI